MSTVSSNNKVKQIITKIKSVPIAAYLLLGLNVIAITAFVCEDLPLHYVFGLGCFAICLITSLWSALGCCSGPSTLISSDVSARIKELQQKMMDYGKSLTASGLESKSINVVIAILLVIYTSSILNGTLQIFLILNLVYCFIFLSKEIGSCLNCYKDCCPALLNKIKYQK